MKSALLGFVTALVLGACGSPEKSAQNQAATVAWLTDDGQTPRVDVTGS